MYTEHRLTFVYDTGTACSGWLQDAQTVSTNPHCYLVSQAFPIYVRRWSTSHSCLLVLPCTLHAMSEQRGSYGEASKLVSGQSTWLCRNRLLACGSGRAGSAFVGPPARVGGRAERLKGVRAQNGHWRCAGGRLSRTEGGSSGHGKERLLKYE